MNRKQRKRKYAFTLIELLVSISIISILISMLLPAMSGSRKHAKRAQCLTRLRELYVAHAQYINTEDRFPDLNNLEDDGTWQFNYVIWDTEDFDNNFGPLVRPDIGVIQNLTILFCPVRNRRPSARGSSGSGLLFRIGPVSRRCRTRNEDAHTPKLAGHVGRRRRCPPRRLQPGAGVAIPVPHASSATDPPGLNTVAA